MPQQQLPPQEYARIVLIIFFLFFIYTSDDQSGRGPGFPTARDYVAERIARSRQALDVLNTTRWQEFNPTTSDDAKYLNLTGFRREDDYAWERLGAWKQRSESFTQEAKGRWRAGKEGLQGDVFDNVTGIVTGRWVRYQEDLSGKQRERALNLTEISPGVDWAFRDPEFWTRNITGQEGKLMLRVDEKAGLEVDMGKEESSAEEEEEGKERAQKPTDVVREVAATVTIQDETSSGDGWDMKVHGMHWPRQGIMLMTTTSEKFAGIFGLPHLTPSIDYYASGQKMLNSSLEKTIETMENAVWIDPSNPWTSSPESQNDATMPVPHCEFLVYVQVHPLKVDLTVSHGYLEQDHIVQEIEKELRFPNGAPIPPVPRLQMSTVLFSPDCGFILESKGPPTFSPTDGEHLVGVKQELWLSSIQNWLEILAVVFFGQILLLKAQSKEASTPSTVGRVSLHTIGMMLMADALMFASLSLLSSTAPNLFPSALLSAFAVFISVALGVRFAGAIYNTQEPERREQLRLQQVARAASTPPRPNSTPTPTPIITAAGADVTELSSPPAVPNNGPVLVPSDQDLDTEILENATAAAAVLPTTNRRPTVQIPEPNGFGAVYLRFVLGLLLLFFISIMALSWSIPFRTAYTNTLAFIYLSFWIPQIRRNVIRNCRKALLWKFIIGQSVLRLLPFAYFYLKEDNILFAQTDWIAFCVLAGWVWIQIWVLVAQEVLGPRWGLPKGWTEEGWDYHPILKEDNVEAGGLPIGLVQTPASPTLDRSRTSEDLGSRKKKDGTFRSVDCAICMQVLEVPVIAAGEDVSGAGAAGGVAGMLARRQYMVTPCRHMFHSTCLEGWMRFRLQCPICRENLPPL